MAKISFVRSINGKILVASILACFALFMAWETNRSAFRALLSSFENVTAPNDKLRLINEISHRVTHLSDIQKALLLKTPSKYYGFFDETKELDLKIDSLKKLSSNLEQSQQLDALKRLLQDRDKLYLNYLDVRWGLVNNKLFSRQVRQLNDMVNESARKTDSLVTTTEKRTTTTTIFPSQTIDEKSNHQGFFRKLFGRKKPAADRSRSNQQYRVVDSQLSVKHDTITHAMRDSLLKDVGNTIHSLEKAQQSKSEQFVRREEMLNKAGTNIISQSLAILKKVENEAIAQTIVNRNIAKNVVEESIQRISLIMLLFFVLTACLLYFILRDVARINKYRQQLELAKDEAEYHALAKHRFLSNMSHEIRTPLQSIIGYSELVKKQTHPNHDDVEAIFKSSEHLLQIVNEVLDYNRIVSGKFTFSNETFNLKKQLDEVIAVLHLQAEKKGISLTVGYGASADVFLTGDPFRLKQVLYNLLGNAIKFTQVGGVVLNVKGDLIGEYVKYSFAIKDTGVGISAGDLSRIFIEFEQARHENQSQKGTGLGLAISKQLIESMGGKISVTSEPGKGSCFMFDLEFAKSNGSDVSTEKNVSNPRQFIYKVWVVDDDRFILDLCARLFGENKIGFRCFSSPSEVLNTTWDYSVKYVFVDMRMPEMGGAELCGMLRKRVPADTLIFALTAQVMPEEQQSVLGQGFNGILLKPFKEHELISLIKSNLQPVSDYNPPVLNIKTIEKMTFGDPGQMAGILLRFSEDSLNDIDELYTRINENDVEMALLLVHRIAGRTAQAGDRELAENFRLTEMELRNDKVLTIEKIKNLLSLIAKLNSLAIAAGNYNNGTVA